MFLLKCYVFIWHLLRCNLLQHFLSRNVRKCVFYLRKPAIGNAYCDVRYQYDTNIGAFCIPQNPALAN